MEKALEEIWKLEEKKKKKLLVLKEFLALILPQQKKLQPTRTLIDVPLANKEQIPMTLAIMPY